MIEQSVSFTVQFRKVGIYVYRINRASRGLQFTEVYMSMHDVIYARPLENYVNVCGPSVRHW